MKERDSYKRLINFIARVILMAAEFAAFAYVWYAYYSVDKEGVLLLWRRGNWAIIGIYCLLLFFFTRSFGGFKVGYLRISDILLSQVLAVFCNNFVGYFFICAVSRDYVNPMPMLALTVFDFVVIFPWVYVTRVIFTKLFPPRKMLVIFDERNPEYIINKINERPDKYHICEAINVKEGRANVLKKVNEYEAIVLCDINSAVRNDILKYCFEHSIRTYVTPKLSDIIITGAEGIYLFDTPLLLSRNHGLSADQLLFKRIMDLIISTILLVILSPFMLITALLIKCYDGGPVFYYQDRLTRDGKVFKIIKFRSMTCDSEKNGVMVAKKNDSRITPVGKLIRRIHFDEIPQLINIFVGDMSFVGPRPERPEIAAIYKEKIPEFDFRLKVKAGLTGYAQVYGRYNTTPYDKLKMDLTYIENYSFFMDIKIILGTVKVIFQKENTEGFDENTVKADERVDDVKKVQW